MMYTLRDRLLFKALLSSRVRCSAQFYCRTAALRSATERAHVCIAARFCLERLLKPSNGSTFDTRVRRHLSLSPVLLQSDPDDDDSKKSKEKKKNKKPKSDEDEEDDDKSFVYKFLLLLAGAGLSFAMVNTMMSRDRGSSGREASLMPFVSWNDFVHNMLAAGEVEEIIIRPDSPQSNVVTIRLHEHAVIRGRPAEHREYSLEVPDSASFEERLRQAERSLNIRANAGVQVIYERTDLPTGALVLLLLASAFAVYLMRGAMKTAKSGGLFNPFNAVVGQMRKAKFSVFDPKKRIGVVKFKDVAGLHEAKVEIREFVDYLKRPETFKKLGAKLPKGALLTGPPGCGKTLLAKALASEASVPFLVVNGTEFVEMIGVLSEHCRLLHELLVVSGLGAARVRDLFTEAKRRAPCIIYIDEIDALGRKRSSDGSDMANSSSEEDQTLNQLLVEMDGMDTDSHVMVLASTNRPDILDKALLRRGRFDRHISIDLPTRLEREEIFQLYLKRIKLAHDSTKYAANFAAMTPGFSGADIANICNEAAIRAASLGEKTIDDPHLHFALERVLAGSEKRSQSVSPAEKRIVAYHEAGHAIVGWMLRHTDALLKISIVPRTGAMLGFAQYNPADRKLLSKEELFERMVMSLGGRAAESVRFNKVTTGAEDDLRRVTKIAYDQIRVYGMSDSLGPLSFAPPPGEERESQFVKKPYSKLLQHEMDQEAQRLVGRAYKAAESIINANKDKLEKLAEELLRKETLVYDEVRLLIGAPPFGEKKTIAEISDALPQPAEEEMPSPASSPPKQTERERD